MTPEQKQIAIAEFEGYSRKECPAGEIEWRCPPPKLQYIGRFSPETVPSNIPSYLTSRDAICGAVARLDDGQKRAFANMLYDLITGTKPNPNGYHLNRIDILAKDMVSFLLATPAQLSDALLLTLGYEL